MMYNLEYLNRFGYFITIPCDVCASHYVIRTLGEDLFIFSSSIYLEVIKEAQVQQKLVSC